jgi:cellobiose transport system permease protein
MNTSDQDRRLRRSAFWHKVDRTASPYVYISPFYILFAIIGLFPLFYTAYIATRQWNIMKGNLGVAVCGLTCPSIGNDPHWYANFLWVLHQPTFWLALRNTVMIFLISTIPQLILALIIAYVLNSKLRAATFWRMGVLLPYMLAPMALAIIFSQVFADNMGLANTIFRALRLPEVAWHSNALASWIAISVIVDIRWTGYNALILLAAMQAIPPETIEAAEVDGASRSRQLFNVMIPQLRPTLIFIVITSTIGGLQIFDEPQMFSQSTSYGGNSYQFLTVTQFLWKTGFQGQTDSNMSRAAAIAWLLFILVIILVLINFLVTRRISSSDVPKRATRAEQRRIARLLATPAVSPTLAPTTSTPASKGGAR